MELIIQTFGGFNISFGSKPAPDISIRRGKMRSVLEFMLAHHKRPVSSEELIDILWTDDECADPYNSLKTTIHRLRKMLASNGNEFQYIVFSNGTYSWNPALNLTIDSADFEKKLIRARDVSISDDERISLYKDALAYYKGEFLRGESGELWLTNFRHFYRRMYLTAVDELAALYEKQSAFEEEASLYNEAIKIEPYEESLYAQQIKLLVQNGEYALAKKQYLSIEKLLQKEFDTEPTAELQGLWLEINQTNQYQCAALDELKTHFDNGAARERPMFCGPETFKRIYSYDKRLDERMQFSVFLGLISIEIADDYYDNDKLRSVTKILRRIMMNNLRACDIICHYSANQFVLLLTTTTDKYKMTPLDRIKRLFNQEPDAVGVKLYVEAIAMGENKTDIFT